MLRLIYKVMFWMRHGLTPRQRRLKAIIQYGGPK